MNELKSMIERLGYVKTAEILDVSRFLNMQIDPVLMQQIGQEFTRLFATVEYDMIVTVEASGIAPSVFMSLHANKPLVVIKKRAERLKDTDYIQQLNHSYTKGNDYFLTVRTDLVKQKRCLLIDDFLASGNLVINVEKLLAIASSELIATGIVISKNFQQGYQRLIKQNKQIITLAGIQQMDPVTQQIIFD